MPRGKSDFVYDKNLHDMDTGIRLSVTVVDKYSDVMLCLKSGVLTIPFFLKPITAMLLAKALTNAVCAYDRANEAETKTSETTG